MGLESVELVMNLEDEFDVVIPDTDAEQVLTVGQCYDLLLRLIRNNPESELAHRPDLEVFVWEKLTQFAAAESICLKAHQITRDTHFFKDLGYQG